MLLVIAMSNYQTTVNCNVHFCFLIKEDEEEKTVWLFFSQPNVYVRILINQLDKKKEKKTSRLIYLSISRSFFVLFFLVSDRCEYLLKEKKKKKTRAYAWLDENSWLLFSALMFVTNSNIVLIRRTKKQRKN